MTSHVEGARRRFLFPLLTATLLTGSLPALAQTTAPEAPPTGQEVVPDATQPQAPTNETLSDKLEDTHGIIKPPQGVDPEMAMPPPDDGTAAGRVIKPPPAVTPK